MIEGKEITLKNAHEAIVLRDERIADLEHELAQFKRMIFGRKSERFIPSDPDQLNIEMEGLEPVEDLAHETERITYDRRKKKTSKEVPVRTEIPAHFPRIEEIIEPEHIPDGSKKIGQEITEILEYNPANIFVRRIIRPKYALTQDSGVLIAELPSLPIPRGNAGASLLGHILVSKFVDHLPFYRQQQIFKRQELTLAKSTITGWFNASSDLLEPLYDCLKSKVQQSNYIMADETPLPVQDSHKQGSTHTGYHWVYYAPSQKLVCFDYRRGRSREGPDLFLKDFQGALQTDGYAGYNQFEHKGGITLLACMAHARRYFDKAEDNDKSRAEYALKLFGKLYAKERRARGWQLSEVDRYAFRLKRSAVIMEELHLWLKDNLNQVRPKSPIGKAIRYSLSLWPRLKGYLDNGQWEIDNNLVENSIRPVALGRKNYLFAGSHPAAQRAAMMYSFFASCKKNGIEPLEWLTQTLERISDHPANRIAELLPVN